MAGLFGLPALARHGDSDARVRVAFRDLPRSALASVATSCGNGIDRLRDWVGASQLLGYAPDPQHFLYFFPLPHEHGSFRPTLGSDRT
jgi:hypothetical protein